MGKIGLTAAIVLTVIVMGAIQGDKKATEREKERQEESAKAIRKAEAEQERKREVARRAADAALPTATRWQSAEKDRKRGGWKVERHHVVSPKADIANTSGRARLQLRCRNRSLDVSLALDEPLYPSGRREGEIAVRWDDMEGKVQRLPAVYWGTLVKVGETAQEEVVTALRQRKAVWIGLEGAEGESLTWSTGLKNARRVIQTPLEKCRLGQGTFTGDSGTKTAGNSPRHGGGGCPYGDKHTAWSYVQRGVSAQMHNPGGADFPFGGYRHLKKTGPCTWTADSWVEGTNLFGATVRQNYTATVTLMPGQGRLDHLMWQ